MFEWLDRFLSVRGLAPHGYCLLWDPALIWAHVVADALIAAAYFSIPVVLWRLLAQRRDLRFGWILGAFAVFILSCGVTHVISILTLWVPAYGWEALVKVITAAASLATAVLLIPLLPKLVAIPSPAALERANEALRIEAEERAKAEAMLRQAHKMQAVGQLSGGLAHDFNNLLSIIIGNLDRVKRKGSETPDGQRAVDNALIGAERAAKLTHQLLAFTRRQPLETQPHDLNDITGSTADLLRQTVGSRIEVRLALEEGLPPGLVDRNQLENALLNLGINARDAMPQGGVITITTRRHSYDLVELAVTDTGSGMDAATLERAAEPFFTTKPVGEGSGLGLSQVLGTIEQLGGRVELQSRPGTGTTVRLFIPVGATGGEGEQRDERADMPR